MTTIAPTPLDEIKKALEFDEMTPKEQEKLMLDLSELIFKGTMIRVLEQMDEKTKDEFHALINKGASQDDLAAFVEENVPGANEAALETVSDLTNDILAVTA